MNDIFISYDSADRAIARKFADALEARGWSVWWDREIPLGKAFDQVIEQELNAARCVIVLWSSESVHSRWVKTEAAAAADRDCMIPVLIDDIEIPFEFRRIQTAMLAHWLGDAADPEFNRLVNAVGELVQKPASPTPSRTTKPHANYGWRLNRAWVALLLVLLLIAGAVGIRDFFGKVSREPAQNSSQPAIDPASTTQGSGSSSSSPSLPASTTKAGLPQGAFSIKVGDKIDDGVPGPGAGSIESPFGQDVYIFGAAPRQRVYFRMLRHTAGMSYINWKLTDADGMEVFNTCLGCAEVGVRTLNKGGTYTLVVGNDKNPATGTYQLQLIDVPPPNQFLLKIGDQIKENVPGSGAGVIESPGAEDIYKFTAAPRQKVYFRKWEHSSGMIYIKWTLTDDDGMEVFDTCLGCSEPGVESLIKGGNYTLTVANGNHPATGTYRVQLYNVPAPGQFSINVGDKIRPGIPAPGAGSIESPGAEDIYTFNTAPGQKVYFRILERSKGTDYINWRLVDENGTELFNTCLACSEPGVQTLTRGGAYTLTIGNSRNPATGDYAFELGAR